MDPQAMRQLNRQGLLIALLHTLVVLNLAVGLLIQ